MTGPEYEEFLAALYREMTAELPVQVFLRRTYRGSSGQDYEIDLSLEFQVLGARYVTFIEAKHYRARIAVGEVLEFAAKLTDAGANKGIMVTTTGFQVGAQVVASSRGIALLVVPFAKGARPRIVLEKPADEEGGDRLQGGNAFASSIREIIPQPDEVR
jgi:hypothetical protein